jgi:anti-sigma B factor antagonist
LDILKEGIIMDSSGLKVVSSTVGETTKVILSGEIDIHSSQGFKTRFNEIVSGCTGDLYIDCAELTYIDSTGLGIMVGAIKELRKDNNSIYILNLKENIKKLFLITGLDKVFKIQ